MVVQNIVDHGAVGDGLTKNTMAITKAVDACIQSESACQVLVPSGGIFLTGSFELASRINLHVQGTLLASNDTSDFPLIPVLPSYGEGRDTGGDQRHRALVFATNVTDVSITGHGRIDGNGFAWWRRYFAHQVTADRPHLIEIMWGSNLTIADLFLENSPFWTVHPYASDHVRVNNLTVKAPPFAPNTDGIDPDSCNFVEITNCHFSVGDDGIAIKSGLNEYGRNFGKPSENIFIDQITIEPRADNFNTNGISIGSEMSGGAVSHRKMYLSHNYTTRSLNFFLVSYPGIRNITVQNIIIRKCAVGLYIKSMEGRGGVVEDVKFTNVTMSKTLEPIRFAMDYTYEPKPPGLYDTDDGTPHFRNITVRNASASGGLVAGTFAGLMDSEIEAVELENVHIQSKAGFQCRNTSGEAKDVDPQACFGDESHRPL